MRYIVDRSLDLDNNAGFKARSDVINIMKDEGYCYKPINYNTSNIMTKIKTLRSAFMLVLEQDSDIIMQYPINRMISNILLEKSLKLNCKLVCFIHDIESLRNNMNNKEIAKEIALLNKFSCVISHNKCMSKWLIENGLQTKILNLDLFDYLSNRNIFKRSINNSFQISYATGILGKEKSAFLYNINSIASEKCKFILYGNIENKLKDKIVNNNFIDYKGPLSPNEISEKIEGNFGLIWDSKDLSECTGVFGEYTKYNNPHKLSMYMAANMPVIVWSKSAISSFVKNNGIGICVDSLCDLNTELTKVTKLQYNEMLMNVSKISEKVRNGEYTKKIIKKIENEL